MKPLPLSPAVRVQPFTGLIIDVDTWATAHEYHRRHHQLHLLSLHGSGVAHGLAVLPTDPLSDTLVVEPGIAIDQAGNVIVVPESQRLALEAREGTVYLVLDYVESLPPSPGSNQQETRGRLVEDFRLRALSEPPEPPALELARVHVASAATFVVSSPANPWLPGPNEIDGRFRSRASPQTPAEVSVGLVVSGAPEELAADHLQGFYHLLRELTACGLRSTLLVSSGTSVPCADMLYVTGAGTTQPGAALVKGISEQLERGAWLFADSCGAGDELAQGLQTALEEGKKTGAETEAQALDAHFVFGTAPAGASANGAIAWGRNAILSARDYGCAWAGRRGKQTLSREEIRSALEFGVNVAVCASWRRTPR